jgi:hypothetical protein
MNREKTLTPIGCSYFCINKLVAFYIFLRGNRQSLEQYFPIPNTISLGLLVNTFPQFLQMHSTRRFFFSILAAALAFSRFLIQAVRCLSEILIVTFLHDFDQLCNRRQTQ